MGTLPLPQGGFSDWQLPTVHIHPEKKKRSKHTITSIMEALGYCDPEKKREQTFPAGDARCLKRSASFGSEA